MQIKSSQACIQFFNACNKILLKFSIFNIFWYVGLMLHLLRNVYMQTTGKTQISWKRIKMFRTKPISCLRLICLLGKRNTCPFKALLKGHVQGAGDGGALWANRNPPPHKKMLSCPWTDACIRPWIVITFTFKYRQICHLNNWW